jgi:glycosyltransferase involved in cell wall biosynthesis
LPAEWKLLPIHGRSEDEVAELLSETPIFLSFSYQEGLPLPPMEAAVSGNIVVGYTGEGGKEYFRDPVFRAIPHGDYRSFVSTTLRVIEQVESNAIFSAEHKRQIDELRMNYSETVERNLLLNFANEIAKLHVML